MAENLNQHIFKRLQNGDEKALNELFDLYYSALCLFANKYLQDMDLARSLVQQVFIDLWTKRERITVSTSVKSYLYTTVKNRCIDVLRKTKATSEISESVENLNQTPFRDLVEEAELNDRINASINQLPEKCREIFLLCRFEGMKYSEIAEKLGILRDSLSDYQMINLLVFIYSKKN